MQKYLREILIGAAAGVVAAFVFTLILGAGAMSILFGAFVGVFTAYILANLAGNRKVAIASDAERAEALKLEAPADQALLVVFREGFVGKMAGLNIAVDGKPLAQLQSPRFTRVALAPGAHQVTAAFGGLAGPQNKPATFDVAAAAGQVIALKVGLKMGMMQNSISLTPEVDLAQLRTKLAGSSMVLPEPAAA